EYLLSGQLHMGSASGDASQATFIVDASSVSRAILVGSTTVDDEVFRISVRLPSLINSAKTGPGWDGFDTSIGVELANLNECKIWEKSIQGFGIGLRASGYGTGFAYNEIYLTRLLNN